MNPKRGLIVANLGSIPQIQTALPEIPVQTTPEAQQPTAPSPTSAPPPVQTF